uniref:Uncharacterized protein n=1 Tax=Physcomitrium patens TaxID=3218 RepID=A9TX78_PHYPA|nr:hypothetical protein PHYPA_004895 [Physcomitrium patens]
MGGLVLVVVAASPAPLEPPQPSLVVALVALFIKIDPGISVRKLLTDQRPMEDTKSTTKREAAASVSVASAKPKPTHHPFKFAFLFASLAKNSTVPSTGTPSPGHN